MTIRPRVLVHLELWCGQVEAPAGGVCHRLGRHAGDTA